MPYRAYKFVAYATDTGHNQPTIIQNCRVFHAQCLAVNQAYGQYLELYLNVLTQRNFVAEFIEKMSVLFVKHRSSVSEPLFGDLGVTYAIYP